MATIPPIPPGGIVSVPDPITGGVGAPVTVAQIVNAKWANAFQMFNAQTARTNDAIDAAKPASQLSTPTLDTSFVPPLKPALFDQNPNDGKAIYDSSLADITDLIQQGFVDFMADNFPNQSYFLDALDWCGRAIRGDDMGIEIANEEALWERGRARLGAESMRAENDAMQAFANRGYPLPPGALVHQIKTIQQDKRDKLAEQSRDITVKTFDVKIENARFAVKEVIDLRMRAIAAAGDYIRTLILGPQTAADLARTLTGLRSDLSRNLVALYQAESAALEPRVRLAIADADLKMRGELANLNARQGSTEQIVRAILANAQVVGSAAAASLNGISAGASISNGADPSV